MIQQASSDSSLSNYATEDCYWGQLVWYPELYIEQSVACSSLLKSLRHFSVTDFLSRFLPKISAKLLPVNGESSGMKSGLANMNNWHESFLHVEQSFMRVFSRITWPILSLSVLHLCEWSRIYTGVQKNMDTIGLIFTMRSRSRITCASEPWSESNKLILSLVKNCQSISRESSFFNTSESCSFSKVDTRWRTSWNSCMV